MAAAYTDTPADRLAKLQRYQSISGELDTEKQSFMPTWRETANFLYPVRPRGFSTPSSERNQGARRSQQIIDETGIFARQTLRSGLHGGLTSPARPFMRLSTPDPSLAKFGPVKQWLHDLTERMHVVFQLSNLFNALPLVYDDMGTFATAAVGLLDDPGDGSRPGDLFRCYPYPIGSYALGMDNRGLVTTFVREYVKTVDQLIQEFGGENGRPLRRRGDHIDRSRFSQQVLNAWDNGKRETPVEVCWIVLPNDEPDADSLGYRAFPWTSCHFEKGRTDAGPLRESGFQEFPILAPRWFASAEDTYGTDCPGLTALGGVKQLQTEQKRKGQAIEKGVNPPIVGPAALMRQKVSVLPGDFTPVDERDGLRGLRPIYEVPAQYLQYLSEDIREVQDRINRAFYVDLFQMLAYSDAQRGSQPPTAREIDERHEEKLMALGPVLESTIDELLDPMIDRVYGMMDRAGLIPPPPPDLEGVTLKVEYISIMAQAQKLLGIAPLDRLLSMIVQSAQTVGPSILLKLDTNKFVDEYADKLGVNPGLIRSDEDANAMLQAQQQAAQSQADAKSAQQLAGAAAALGKTPMTGDTALTRVLEGAAAA